jgi:hypothetical protein
VEHVLNDWTRDCEYFTPPARRPAPAD